MDIGKTIIIMGIVLIIVGVAFTLLSGTGGIPRLPGDIYIKRGNFTFYFPIVTSILISIILTIIFQLFFKEK